MRRSSPIRQPLLRLVAVNGAFGAAMGALATALLVGGDAFGLAGLVLRDGEALLGLGLLSAGLMGLCAAASVATAVMLLGAREPGPGSGPGELVPVPVRARRPGR